MEDLLIAVTGVVGDGFSVREVLCVRSCCFILSLRVKALLHVGQWMFFSPVCFLPWRAAWPEVVKVSVQEKRAACGQGYFFLTVLEEDAGGVVLLEGLLALVVVGEGLDVGEATGGGRIVEGGIASAGFGAVGY